MGLFGKLFEKKNCDICGEKIGLLGNRKLSDGNLCKDCAAKLSPFFTERRVSSIEEIKEQLDYHEKNKEEVANFTVTRTMGAQNKILLDENHQKLMIVTSKNWAKENPDVLDFQQLTGCQIDVKESKNEMYCRDSEGSSHSYNPPQYRYSYDIYVVLHVNSPYFDEIRFKLNNCDITIEPQIQVTPPTGMGNFHRPPAKPNGIAGERGTKTKPPAPVNNRVINSYTISPLEDSDYRRFWEMGQEIKETLLNLDRSSSSSYQNNVPQKSVTCPWCGATTLRTATGTCEYCGGALD